MNKKVYNFLKWLAVIIILNAIIYGVLFKIHFDSMEHFHNKCILASLIEIYSGICLYKDKYDKYPSSLDELINEKFLKKKYVYCSELPPPPSIFSNTKLEWQKAKILYFNNLKISRKYPANTIVVAVPMPSLGSRMVIVINNFNIKKNSHLYIKNISEDEFQKQIKEQDWKIK